MQLIPEVFLGGSWLFGRVRLLCLIVVYVRAHRSGRRRNGGATARPVVHAGQQEERPAAPPDAAQHTVSVVNNAADAMNMMVLCRVK